MKKYIVVCRFWSSCSGYAKPWIEVCASYKEALAVLSKNRKEDWAELG